jgi:hypothetical protein
VIVVTDDSVWHSVQLFSIISLATADGEGEIDALQARLCAGGHWQAIAR